MSILPRRSRSSPPVALSALTGGCYRLAAVAEPPDDLASLLNIIDGLTAKNRLKTLASGIS